MSLEEESLSDLSVDVEVEEIEPDEPKVDQKKKTRKKKYHGARDMLHRFEVLSQRKRPRFSSTKEYIETLAYDFMNLVSEAQKIIDLTNGDVGKLQADMKDVRKLKKRLAKWQDVCETVDPSTMAMQYISLIQSIDHHMFMIYLEWKDNQAKSTTSLQRAKTYYLRSKDLRIIATEMLVLFGVRCRLQQE